MRYQFRRSFGSSPLTTKEDLANQSIGSGGSGLQQSGGAEGGDWPALQANYTYLMSCDLIETCRSLNGEMSWDNQDLEHLRQANQTVTTANSPSVAVGCQTDAEIAVSIPGMANLKFGWHSWNTNNKVVHLTCRFATAVAEAPRVAQANGI